MVVEVVVVVVVVVAIVVVVVVVVKIAVGVAKVAERCGTGFGGATTTRMLYALVDRGSGCVSDMKIPRRLWGESCDHLALLGVL